MPVCPRGGDEPGDVVKMSTGLVGRVPYGLPRRGYHRLFQCFDIFLALDKLQLDSSPPRLLLPETRSPDFWLLAQRKAPESWIQLHAVQVLYLILCLGEEKNDGGVVRALGWRLFFRGEKPLMEDCYNSVLLLVTLRLDELKHRSRPLPGCFNSEGEFRWRLEEVGSRLKLVWNGIGTWWS